MAVDITMKRPRIRRFHQAKWDEPIIFELSQEGARGILVPQAEEEVKSEVGDVLSSIPQGVRRKRPPKLPRGPAP